MNKTENKPCPTCGSGSTPALDPQRTIENIKLALRDYDDALNRRENPETAAQKFIQMARAIFTPLKPEEIDELLKGFST